MKKVIVGFVVGIFIISSSAVSAANNQIKIDGTTIITDLHPVIKNNRVMVPLRMISENLGAQVDWSNSKVIVTKGNTTIHLTPNSNKAIKNGQSIIIDGKPFIENQRLFVPLRFIAEAFDSKVNYSNSTVSVDTKPLIINDVKVDAIQHEYHMFMGGVVQQIQGNANIDAIYQTIMKYKHEKVEAPAHYSWQADIDTPGFFHKNAQYDFLNSTGTSIKQYDIYSLLIQSSAPINTHKILLHDVTENQWYVFSQAGHDSIIKQIENARVNGFLVIISNNAA